MQGLIRANLNDILIPGDDDAEVVPADTARPVPRRSHGRGHCVTVFPSPVMIVPELSPPT